MILKAGANSSYAPALFKTQKKQNMYKTIKVNGRQHVISDVNRRPVVVEKFGEKVVEKQHQPNYRGTGLALCGVLQPGQSLAEFAKTHPKEFSN